MSNILEQSYNVGLSSINQGFNSATALQIRLDPTQTLESVEMFFRGAKIIVEQTDTGEIITRRVTLGEPKANDHGIQALLNWVQTILNPRVAQGDFVVDSPHYSSQYSEYVKAIRINLSSTLLENLYEWQIKETDLNYIVDFIMNIIEPFTTRLIGNEERKSYANTISHQETSQVKENNRSMNLFGVTR